MSTLTPKVTPKLVELTRSLGPLAAGGGLTAAYTKDLVLEILGLGTDCREIEGLAQSNDIPSRRLFALAGLLQKHADTGVHVTPADVRLLHRVLTEVTQAIALAEVQIDRLRAPGPDVPDVDERGGVVIPVGPMIAVRVPA